LIISKPKIFTKSFWCTLYSFNAFMAPKTLKIALGFIMGLFFFKLYFQWMFKTIVHFLFKLFGNYFMIYMHFFNKCNYSIAFEIWNKIFNFVFCSNTTWFISYYNTNIQCMSCGTLTSIDDSSLTHKKT
jgi:hypothetical protein